MFFCLDRLDMTECSKIRLQQNELVKVKIITDIHTPINGPLHELII